jgi:hypothetical protein
MHLPGKAEPYRTDGGEAAALDLVLSVKKFRVQALACALPAQEQPEGWTLNFWCFRSQVLPNCRADRVQLLQRPHLHRAAGGTSANRFLDCLRARHGGDAGNVVLQRGSPNRLFIKV